MSDDGSPPAEEPETLEEEEVAPEDGSGSGPEAPPEEVLPCEYCDYKAKGARRKRNLADHMNKAHRSPAHSTGKSGEGGGGEEADSEVEEIFAGPEADLQDRRSRLLAAIKNLPIAPKARGYIVSQWDLDPAVREDPYQLHDLLSELKGLHPRAVSRTVRAVFNDGDEDDDAPRGADYYGGGRRRRRFRGGGGYRSRRERYDDEDDDEDDDRPRRRGGRLLDEEEVDRRVRAAREQERTRKENEDLKERLARLEKERSEGSSRPTSDGGFIETYEPALGGDGQPIKDDKGEIVFRPVKIPRDVFMSMGGFRPQQAPAAPARDPADDPRFKELKEEMKEQRRMAEEREKEQRAELKAAQEKLVEVSRSASIRSEVGPLEQRIAALQSTLEGGQRAREAEEATVKRLREQGVIREGASDATQVAIEDLRTQVAMQGKRIDAGTSLAQEAIRLVGRSNKPLNQDNPQNLQDVAPS